MTNPDTPSNQPSGSESGEPVPLGDALKDFIGIDLPAHAESEAERKEQANLKDAEAHEADAAQELYDVAERQEAEGIPQDVVDDKAEIFHDAHEEAQYYGKDNGATT